MKDTPGPWYQRPVDRRIASTISASSPREALANARLIEAAPVLLAACEAVLLALIGGRKTSCFFCFTLLDSQEPWHQGGHRGVCPVPAVLDPVEQARTA